MNRFIKSVLGIACIASLCLPAYAGCKIKALQEGETSKPVKLKLGHIQSENDLWHLGSIRFKEEAEKNSKGNIEVMLFPNSTLGGDRDMAEGMQMGTVDLALIAGVLGNFEPTIQLLELPYLFENQEEFNRVVNGDIGKKIAENVHQASGICILSYWNRGPRHVTSNIPINSLADIKGLKIRMPEIAAMVDTWKAMGATPTPMAWSEVYTGLEQKVIEAQENPIPFIFSGRIHEVQKYLALTAHKYEYVTVSMSARKWEQLTGEQQRVIMDAVKVATVYENELVEGKTKEILETMVSEGLQVTEPDRKQFAEKARMAHEKFARSVDYDFFQEIMTAIDRK